MAQHWLSLVGAIWLQAISGTNTNFPAYSSHLKRLLSLSQLQLNNLAFASDAGKLLGWFSGLAAARLPLWLVLLVGSFLGLIGYGAQYLFLTTDRFPSLSYGHVFLLTVLAGNSICWINTVCYIVCVENFPLDRHVAVGLSTSYSGLSAKIYTDAVQVAFRGSSPAEKARSYLLLNSVLPLAVCTVVAPLVKYINAGKSRDLAVGFIAMFVITIATGMYSVIGSIVTGAFSSLGEAIGMGVFLALPILVPVSEIGREKLEHKCRLREARVHSVMAEEDGSGDGGRRRKEEGVAGAGDEGLGIMNNGVKEEIGAREMVRRIDFWLYYFVYLTGATVGMVYMNNLGQITESRGSSRTSSVVSLSSSFGFFGRLISSIFDYYLSRSKYKVSRPATMAAMMAPMSAAFFILLNGSDTSLFISTAIIGTCGGAITSVAVSTTAELFGTKNLGVNHNVLVTNIPLGSFLFGNMAAIIYRTNGGGNGDGSRCMGLKCYELTFIVWGSLCCFGTFLAIILHARTKKFYNSLQLL